jgi:hypothetical protein
MERGVARTVRPAGALLATPSAFESELRRARTRRDTASFNLQAAAHSTIGMRRCNQDKWSIVEM